LRDADAVSEGRRRARRAEAERNDQALLEAAREVLAEDGAHASVAAIAARAGLGIGSLYRRYRTKEELFQRLCTIALNGLRASATHPLPGFPPGYQLFTERWARTTAPR
jgi:AcrR family transcriptional regulator